ncbi:peptidylprolyl isomerase [Polaribacter sargassicola]|uniref:peptidylprolyl isomerase n=1 Tax=Polaribacter sargassicola TaxID=2836891 RepID=UPI001F23DAA2|nr:peptidylprolyl isomerase [Polaribacter sp. DS7-9]MCG1036426.1 peptidylprolyl isomerase [Polaribacter sp. DS7-9]
MQQKTTISKYIKLSIYTFFLGFIALQASAQKTKIDGVAVVIGKNIVLDSDIDKFKQEIETRSEGKVQITDCEMLEELMQQKLLAHHAIVDSVVVSDVEISSRVERSIQYFTQQYGNIEKVIKAYGFNDLEDLKKELNTVQEENILIEKEQQKITEKIDVTPEEVRLYFNGLKEKGDLPQFPAEIELAQIVLKAIPTKEEEERVIAKLNEIKEQIEGGSNFKMKAIINSDDPGVTSNGGEYTVTKESNFIKEFKEMAFTLDVNQVSEPFKSQFGYHIMQLHAIKGNTRIASHILIKPVVTDNMLKELEDKANDIINEIKKGEVTFEEAVLKYSTDEDSKFSGGLIINPSTGESRFDLTRMDPAFYARVSDLKKGEMTEAFYDKSAVGEEMFKFILMKDRTDTHTADIIKDYEKVQQLALQKKKEETIDKWSREKIKDTYIKIGDSYSKCDFNKNWKKEINK